MSSGPNISRSLRTRPCVPNTTLHQDVVRRLRDHCAATGEKFGAVIERALRVELGMAKESGDAQ